MWLPDPTWPITRRRKVWGGFDTMSLEALKRDPGPTEYMKYTWFPNSSPAKEGKPVMTKSTEYMSTEEAVDIINKGSYATEEERDRIAEWRRLREIEAEQRDAETTKANENPDPGWKRQNMLQRLWGRLWRKRNEYQAAFNLGNPTIEPLKAVGMAEDEKVLMAHLDEYQEAARQGLKLLQENDYLKTRIALLEGDTHDWVPKADYERLRKQLREQTHRVEKAEETFWKIQADWTNWFMKDDWTVDALPDDIKASIYEHVMKTTAERLKMVKEHTEAAKPKPTAKRTARRGSKAS